MSDYLILYDIVKQQGLSYHFGDTAVTFPAVMGARSFVCVGTDSTLLQEVFMLFVLRLPSNWQIARSRKGSDAEVEQRRC